MSASAPTPRKTGNGRVALICAAVAVAMVGLAYAAVPLYRVFCEATGFDGAVRKGAGPTEAALHRRLTIRFDTNVRGLPWNFKPEVASQPVRIGEPAMAWFKVRNDGDVPITGRATYNVAPETAGAYFVKTECFCFKDQTIPAHTEMRFPVIFYVEPGFAKDRQTQLFEEITLSYTYFPSTKSSAPAAPAPIAAAKPREGLVAGATTGL